MNILNKEIINCTKCSRLVNFREKIAFEKRKQFSNETYWGKPVPGFGDLKAEILILGLAPAAHGGIELEDYLLETNQHRFYLNVFSKQN